MLTFLKYSLHHQKKIKVILCINDGMQSKNIIITELGENQFSYIASNKQKNAKTLPIDALLCAGYARGDHGEA